MLYLGLIIHSINPEVFLLSTVLGVAIVILYDGSILVACLIDKSNRLNGGWSAIKSDIKLGSADMLPKAFLVPVAPLTLSIVKYPGSFIYIIYGNAGIHAYIKKELSNDRIVEEPRVYITYKFILTNQIFVIKGSTYPHQRFLYI